MSSALSGDPSPLLQMPSPVPSMSRAGSDTASSRGPLTPNSIYQSFLDRRGDSFSSSTDVAPTGSALAYLSEVESLDDDAEPQFRELPPAPGFHSSRMEKYSFATTLPVRGTSTAAETTVSDPSVAEASIAPSTRNSLSLLGRTSSLSEASTLEPARAGSSLSFNDTSIGDETVRPVKAEPKRVTLLDRRASESPSGNVGSSQLQSSDDWSKRFRRPRHSIASHGAASPSLNSPSTNSPSLNSPSLTMDPKRAYLQASTASSPASEQFPVNSYGPRSEQERISRSASQQSLSTDSSPAAGSGLDRTETSLPKSNVSTPLAGVEISKDITHLSVKEIARLEKEERKRIEKEEKQRRKAEKAEYKRLAAEAVFGPKGSSGPTPAPANSDFAMYTAGTQTTTGDALSSRRSSEPCDGRSGTSTASPRTGSSIKYSSRNPAPTALAKKGEWAVTTATGGGPWFSAPPPAMMAPARLGGLPKGGRNGSVGSLSGRSSTKTRLTS